MGTAQWFLQNGTAVLSGGTASGLLMPGKKEAGCSGVRVPFTRSPGSHLQHDTTLQPVMDSFSASASHLSDGCINRCLANWFGLGKHKLLQKRGFLPLRFAYIDIHIYIYVCIVNIPGLLRVDTNMRWLTRFCHIPKGLCLLIWGRREEEGERTESESRWPWEEQAWKLLNGATLFWGGGGALCGTEVSHSAWLLGSHLEIVPEKWKYWDLGLSAFHQVHQVLDGFPLARDLRWTALPCRLGRLSAGFGPAEQSPLVHWSSHRLFARPAQNPVSSDFLCSCIIFPCFLNACPQCGGSSLTLLNGEQDVEGGQGCGNITQGFPGPCGWRAGEQGSPNYLTEDFSIRVVRETVQVYTHRHQSS